MAYEPLYDIEPRTGVRVEIFYADRALAKSFGRSAGWFWWSCQSGFLPDDEPTGPFDMRDAAHHYFALIEDR
jgi:hypothetical protein